MSVTHDEILDPSKLCLACGMCCTGAIFDRARLVNDEIERVAPDQILPTRDGKASAFKLPCPHLQGDNACGIYGNRFRVCSGYSCSLLDRYKTGAISLADALEIVDEAKTKLRQTGRASLTRSELEAEIEQLSNWQGIEDTAERRKTGKRYLELRAAQMFISANFRGRRNSGKENASSTAPHPAHD